MGKMFHVKTGNCGQYCAAKCVALGQTRVFTEYENVSMGLHG